MEYLQYFFSVIEKDKKKVEQMELQIKNLLMFLYNEYEKTYPTAKETEAATRHNSNANTVEPICQNSHFANIEKFLQMRKEKNVIEIMNEVDKYMNDAVVDPRIKKFNVLNWWKEHSKGYPVLSKIVRDVLAVPASTVASESAFSVGSKVVDPFRASLTPKMVQALVCTSDWLKAGGFSFFKDPSQAELELYDECENVETGDPELVDG